MVYSSHIEDFWENAQLVEDNGNVSIHSNVQGSAIIVTEDVIRRVLALNDEMGLNYLEMDEVHGIFRRMGYQGEFVKTMVKKSNVSYNWRFLIHVFIHCLSPRKGGFNEMSFSLATGFVAHVTGHQFNFFGFLFNNMKRNLEDLKLKFLLYPRFMQMIINSEEEELMPEGVLVCSII